MHTRHYFYFANILLLIVVMIGLVGADLPHHPALAQDNTDPNAYGVEWSPDGKWIAIPSTDGLWMANAEIVERAPIQYFAGSLIPAIAFDPSRNRMAVYDETARLIHIIKPTTGDIMINIPGAVGELDFAYDLQYSPDGDFLAVAYHSSLTIYDAVTNQEYRSYTSSPVNSVVPATEPGKFVAGTRAGSISTFDVTDADSAQSSFSPDELMDYPSIHQVALLPDSTEGLARRWTGLIRFDLEDQTSRLFDPKLPENVRSFAVNHMGDTLAIGMDGQLILYDLTTNTITNTIPTVEDTTLFSLSFSPDDSQLVTLDTSGTIQIWDVAEGRVTVTWDNNFSHAYGPTWG